MAEGKPSPELLRRSQRAAIYSFKPLSRLAIEKATRRDDLDRGRRLLEEQFDAHRFACAFCPVVRPCGFRRLASGASAKYKMSGARARCKAKRFKRQPDCDSRTGVAAGGRAIQNAQLSGSVRPGFPAFLELSASFYGGAIARLVPVSQGGQFRMSPDASGVADLGVYRPARMNRHSPDEPLEQYGPESANCVFVSTAKMARVRTACRAMGAHRSSRRGIVAVFLVRECPC